MAKYQMNPAKERLANGKPISVMMITMPSVPLAQLWARSGVDVICFDMEHGVIDINSLHAMLAATAGTGVTPIVRVPWSLPWLVKTVLDAGALGIMFPMGATAQDFQDQVRAVRYPPRGERGWGPFWAQYRWGQTLPNYVETMQNDELLTVSLVERPEAIANIDEIAKVDGVDLILPAPYDLTMTMGHTPNPGKPFEPDVQAAIDKAEAACRAAKKPMCGVAYSAEQMKAQVAKGYLGMFIGFDWMLLQRVAMQSLDGMRQFA